VEGNVGAGGSRLERVAVGDVSTHRLCAEPGHRLRRLIASGQRSHCDPLADEAFDQAAADEA
jgi:hypothetical protein